MHVLIICLAEKSLHVSELIGNVKATCRSLNSFGYTFVEIKIFKSSMDISSFPVINMIKFVKQSFQIV